MTRPGEPTREVLGNVLGDVYQGPAWHGASLIRTLRGVSAAQARRRPGPGRNSIWEMLLHLSYARYRVLRRLGVNGLGRFPRPLAKAWWPRPPGTASDSEWRRDLQSLADYQARLLDAISRVPDAALRRRRPSQPRSLAYEVLGVMAHDAYHTGQIRLLLRLRSSPL